MFWREEEIYDDKYKCYYCQLEFQLLLQSPATLLQRIFAGADATGNPRGTFCSRRSMGGGEDPWWPWLDTGRWLKVMVNGKSGKIFFWGSCFAPKFECIYFSKLTPICPLNKFLLTPHFWRGCLWGGRGSKESHDTHDETPISLGFPDVNHLPSGVILQVTQE